jgi:hypothetical protein
MGIAAGESRVYKKKGRKKRRECGKTERGTGHSRSPLWGDFSRPPEPHYPHPSDIETERQKHEGENGIEILRHCYRLLVWSGNRKTYS